MIYHLLPHLAYFHFPHLLCSESVTAVYYCVLVTKAGYTTHLNAAASIQTVLSVATLTAKVTFVRTDGTSFVFEEPAVYVTLERIINMNSVYVSTKVMVEDLTIFQEKITTLVQGKVTTTATLTVTVLRQEECLSMAGYVLNMYIGLHTQILILLNKYAYTSRTYIIIIVVQGYCLASGILCKS